LVWLSVDERRIILTRDRGILKRSAVTHGYWLRHTRPRAQLEEVVRAFDLWSGLQPFQRCIGCNGTLRRVAKTRVRERIPPRAARAFEVFSECAACGRIYWRGSHFERLAQLVSALLRNAPASGD
ncbi:MAG: twitching motility protein PilT, partial [Gammaproteobacteria bacterium]|nr:twitching motility protein PilT [Gammaproteobacteria bacterium]